MDKVGKKCRDISFRSEKNQKVICVHSRETREYARILESDELVVSYETCYRLDMERYQFVSPWDIRKDYFDVDVLPTLCFTLQMGALESERLLQKLC